MVATLVGLRVALESVLHSMVAPSPQAKSKTMVKVKVNLRKAIAAMVEQRTKFNRRVAQMVEVKAKVKAKTRIKVRMLMQLKDLSESVTVGIAGMSFKPLATYTDPVLIDDYQYFILAVQDPDLVGCFFCETC